MKYRLKHIVEYALVRFLFGLVCLMPYRMALGFGWVLARLAYMFAKKRVTEAKRRIREVFGEQYSEHEVTTIAWISLRNVFFNAVELMRLPVMPAEAYIKNLTIHGEAFSELKEKALNGRGAVATIPHMGNWDLSGLIFHKLGVPVFFLTGVQKNPLTDRFLQNMRNSTGVETIPRTERSLLRKVVRNIKSGQVLAIMSDLRSREPGVEVDFLGGRANLAGGVVAFSQMAGVPVYPVVLRREGWTKYVWEYYDCVEFRSDADKTEERQRVMQEVINIYDSSVRKHPEQYFWYNKRWILDPLETAE